MWETLAHRLCQCSLSFLPSSLGLPAYPAHWRVLFLLVFLGSIIDQPSWDWWSQKSQEVAFCKTSSAALTLVCASPVRGRDRVREEENYQILSQNTLLAVCVC